MKVYFRFHRGGFYESLETLRVFDNFDDLIFFLVDYGFNVLNMRVLASDITIKYYDYDTRLEKETFIVSICSIPIGFIYW